MNSTLILLILLIFFLISLNNHTYIENFNSSIIDNFDPIYCKYYNNTFNHENLFSSDINKIFKKYSKNIKNSIVLDAGTGCGKHYKYLSKIFPHVIGIDKSENMLKYAQINNPSGKFINNNLLNQNNFTPKLFTHITCLTDTLYHNSLTDIDKILLNFNIWLKDDGKLILHIFNRKDLDPCPMDYSQYYKDKNGVKHSLTYFNTYTHDSYWKNLDENRVMYIENIITKNKKHKITKTILYIPENKDIILDKLRQHGFKLEDILSLNDVGNNDLNIYFFKKISI